MRKTSFLEIVNIDILKKMADNLYAAAGVPIGILGVDGEVYIKAGWQDICTDYHRANPDALKRCLLSDCYINEYIKDGGYIAYKCLNNMWDIAMPIIISDQHIATLFLGQFFYDDEIIDEEYFRKQAAEFGFDEKEYLAALKKVPIFSKDKVQKIIDYYMALVTTLAESGLRLLENEKIQSELEKREQYINTVFNSVNDGIVIYDTMWNVIDVNETYSKMFGYSRDELIGMKVDEFISEKSSFVFADIEEIVNSEEAVESQILELIVKDKDGNDFWAEVNAHIAKIGDYNRYVIVIRDISERKQSEQELNNKTAEMERLKTEFFANISHELRTPLNIILSAVQMIGVLVQDDKKPIDRGKIIKNLNIERQNCLRLLRLINNLIDSTRLDCGDFDSNMVNCDIVSLIEEITLSVAEYIKNNKLKLTFNSDITERIIACDLDKIERIMLNLLSNSVKFTEPGGSIHVNVSDEGEYITISVEDTGIGIPKDKLNTVFDRFKQVDKSFTRKHEGSGIGLSIVKSLVELHGGVVSVTSKYGEGTKFIVKLPVKTIDAETVEKGNKSINAILDSYSERLKFEFSDI